MTPISVIKSGKLASQQLQKPPKDPSTVIYLANHGQDRYAQPQKPSPLSMLDDDDQATIIYQAFMSALLSSTTTKLAKGGDWFEFGTDSCMRVIEDHNASTTTYSYLHQDGKHVVQQVCLNFRWSLPGTMAFYGHVINHVRLFRLSDIVNADGTLGQCTVIVGDHVFLLPFGAHYKFAGLENHASGTFGADRQAKESIKALLASFGIQLAIKPVWACLDTTEGQLHRTPLNGLRTGRIWWPTNLCFIMPSANRPGSAGVLRKVADGTFVDPLAEAEQWFLERGVREAAIATRRRVDEETRLREKYLSESGIELQENDESAIARANRTEQYLSAQEASGIYPTPPDGLTSHPQGSVTNQGSAGYASVEPHATSPGDLAFSRGSRNASPALAMVGRGFGKDEDQDLFGDMDTDMFDTNGLTEADFNFFDELDIKEDVPGSGYGPSAVVGQGTPPPKEKGQLQYAGLSSHANRSDSHPELDEGVNDNLESEQGTAPSLALSFL